MSEQRHASGTITLHLIENGATLATRFEVRDQAGNTTGLYQIVDTGSGAVSPDWGVAPITVEPVVNKNSTRLPLVAGTHEWSYNGNVIAFDSNGASTASCGAEAGTFSLNDTTGVLTIKKNVASAANADNDVLSYKGKAKVSDIQNEEVSHSATIEIISNSEGTYLGVVTPGEAFLTDDHRFEDFTGKLYLGATEVSKYSCKWLIDDVEVTTRPVSFESHPMVVGGDSSGLGAIAMDRMLQVPSVHSIRVFRSKVDGQALLICEFYVSLAAGALPCERGSAVITDLTDDVRIILVSDIGENIDRTQTATVTGKLMKQESFFSPTGASWKIKALTPDMLDQAKRADGTTDITSSTDTLTVSGADLAANKGQLVVKADCNW